MKQKNITNSEWNSIINEGKEKLYPLIWNYFLN